MNKNDANESSIRNDFFYTKADSIECAKKLTLEQIRNRQDFKNISEEQAKEVIDTLYKLSIITFKIYKGKQWD